MTLDELAAFLSENGHRIAWDQRAEFQRETQRQEAARAERAKRSGSEPALAAPAGVTAVLRAAPPSARRTHGRVPLSRSGGNSGRAGPGL